MSHLWHGVFRVNLPGSRKRTIKTAPRICRKIPHTGGNLSGNFAKLREHGTVFQLYNIPPRWLKKSLQWDWNLSSNQNLTMSELPVSVTRRNSRGDSAARKMRSARARWLILTIFFLFSSTILTSTERGGKYRLSAPLTQAVSDHEKRIIHPNSMK